MSDITLNEKIRNKINKNKVCEQKEQVHRLKLKPRQSNQNRIKESVKQYKKGEVIIKKLEELQGFESHE